MQRKNHETELKCPIGRMIPGNHLFPWSLRQTILYSPGKSVLFSGQGGGRHDGKFRLMFTCIPNRRYLRFNRALLAFQLSLVWRTIRPYLDCNQALLATHLQPAVKQGDMEG